jgi:hypothetical protein
MTVDITAVTHEMLERAAGAELDGCGLRLGVQRLATLELRAGAMTWTEVEADASYRARVVARREELIAEAYRFRAGVLESPEAFTCTATGTLYVRGDVHRATVEELAITKREHVEALVKVATATERWADIAQKFALHQKAQVDVAAECVRREDAEAQRDGARSALATVQNELDATRGSLRETRSHLERVINERNDVMRASYSADVVLEDVREVVATACGLDPKHAWDVVAKITEMHEVMSTVARDRDKFNRELAEANSRIGKLQPQAEEVEGLKAIIDGLHGSCDRLREERDSARAAHALVVAGSASVVAEVTELKMNLASEKSMACLAGGRLPTSLIHHIEDEAARVIAGFVDAKFREYPVSDTIAAAILRHDWRAK